MDPNIEYDDEKFLQIASEHLVDQPTPTLTTRESSIPSTTPIASILLPNDSYVTSLVSLSPSIFAAASSSPENSNDITYLNILPSSIKVTQTIPEAHKDSITALRSVDSFPGSSSPHVLFTSSKDGTIKVWDWRTSSSNGPILTVRAPKSHGILAFDLCGADNSYLAAGTELVGDEAAIQYCDLRSPKNWLHSHTYTHSDDITCLHFLSKNSNDADPVLLSASSDGLLCTSHAREADDDEAVISVANWKTSISKCGAFVADDGPAIWAASDMETLSTWDMELNEKVVYGDMRRLGIDGIWDPNYIIDCTSLGEGSPRAGLGAWMGSNNGEFALITPESAESWHLEQIFKTGHSAIVRCLLRDDDGATIVTGGEDSRVCLWSLMGESGHSPLASAKDEDGDAVMGHDTGMESPRKKKRSANEVQFPSEKSYKKGRISH